MCKISFVLLILALAGFLALPLVSQAANTLDYGSLVTDEGITATDGWKSAGEAGFKIVWDTEFVTTGPYANRWYYEYTVSNDSGGDLAKGLSHIIFQVSEGTTRSDFFGFSVNELAVTGPRLEGPPESGLPGSAANPGLPAVFYGMKFDQEYDGNEAFNAYKFTLSFYSTRAPMWGDFYAKDGKSGGVDVYAYNADFGKPWYDGAYKIAVPDTVVVPLPGAVLLLSSGLVRLVAYARRRD